MSNGTSQCTECGEVYDDDNECKCFRLSRREKLAEEYAINWTKPRLPEAEIAALSAAFLAGYSACMADAEVLVRVKPQDKILTYEQARELKWFCKNIAGTRIEFYDALDEINKFKARIDRLQQTADLILKWCEENGIKMIGESP